MKDYKKLLFAGIVSSTILSSSTSAMEPVLTPTQLHAVLGVVTNFILDDGITHNGTSYGTVTSPYTGRVWLDRNLGADRVCTSFDDTECYGDYYQWGRGHDGHQASNSLTTGTQATDVNNVGHGDFITDGAFPYDWASVDNDGVQRSDNWIKKDASSVCPVGFRVPTITELKAETLDEGVIDNVTAFSNFLKFPTAGTRSGFSGSIVGVGSWGNIWSVLANGSDVSLLGFDASAAAVYSDDKRVHGQSVRCIKQITPEEVVHNGTVYGTVTSPYTGKIWLDRNLGADRVCTSLDDTQCYGDYYQWGRGFDGHQESVSQISSTQATDVNTTGSGDFITGSIDWASVDSDGSIRSENWSKIDGSFICPVGYRVPSIEELNTELLDIGSAQITDNIDAFNSFLKFPSAGFRLNSDGTMNTLGTWGIIWTSSSLPISPTSTDTFYLTFDNANASSGGGGIRAFGQSVRCVKD